MTLAGLGPPRYPRPVNSDVPRPRRYRAYRPYFNVPPPSRPLPRYPWGLPKEKRMTIAAGFVLDDGILLCADTLYTDGYTKEYRDKIFPWAGKYAAACFAMAGNSDIARMAVEDCRAALSAAKTDELSTTKILRLVRPILKRTYETYVDQRPHEDRESAHFELLIGLVTRTEEPALFVVRPGFAPVDTFECIGGGRQLGRHIIEPSYDRHLTVNRAVVLAIQALAATKQRVNGVGGQSQFLVLRDKVLSAVVPHDVNRSEPLVLEYFRRCSDLLVNLADQGLSDDEIRDRLDRFIWSARDTREQWLSHAAPWRELMESLSRRATSSETGQT